jgi:hypothetical protein
MAIVIPQLLLVILRNSLFLLCMKGSNVTWCNKFLLIVRVIARYTRKYSVRGCRKSTPPRFRHCLRNDRPLFTLGKISVGMLVSLRRYRIKKYQYDIFYVWPQWYVFGSIFNVPSTITNFFI